MNLRTRQRHNLTAAEANGASFSAKALLTGTAPVTETALLTRTARPTWTARAVPARPPWGAGQARAWRERTPVPSRGTSP
jgi:hypothetical protein